MKTCQKYLNLRVLTPTNRQLIVYKVNVRSKCEKFYEADKSPRIVFDRLSL